VFSACSDADKIQQSYANDVLSCLSHGRHKMILCRLTFVWCASRAPLDSSHHGWVGDDVVCRWRFAALGRDSWTPQSSNARRSGALARQGNKIWMRRTLAKGRPFSANGRMFSNRLPPSRCAQLRLCSIDSEWTSRRAPVKAAAAHSS
jgi:hypothetical protein